MNNVHHGVQILLKLSSNVLLGTGLSDHDNYHVFCRLLARFKSNFQVSLLQYLFAFDGFLKIARSILTLHGIELTIGLLCS